jgi:hypothetical protein
MELSAEQRGALGGMGSHHRGTRGESDEWYTPPHVFEALGLRFDLDPCSPEGGLPWVPAQQSYCLKDDGLVQPWRGRVWLNPPYGPQTEAWMRKLALHGDGVALVFARTDARWWHAWVPTASAVCLMSRRLSFVDRDCIPAENNSGAPSALVAFGDGCAEAVLACGLGMMLRPAERAVTGQVSLWDAL